jgi:hypothetical protein
MDAARQVVRVAFAVAVAVTALGLVLAGASALAAGDWYTARQPWIGLGIAAFTWGLAATDVMALALVIVEPAGWWRLLAVLPASYLAFYWTLYLLWGVPTTAPVNGPEHDMGAIFYSSPRTMGLFIGLTVLLTLPIPLAAITRRLRGGPPTDS